MSTQEQFRVEDTEQECMSSPVIKQHIARHTDKARTGIVAALAFVSSVVQAGMPANEAARDDVDLVEVNHFYNENGTCVFDQLIFYDWYPRESAYQVRAWRLMKSPNQFPVKDWERGDWSIVWQDGDIMRNVRAADFRESWTQYDVELAERDNLPKERRREFVRLSEEFRMPTPSPSQPGQSAELAVQAAALPPLAPEILIRRNPLADAKNDPAPVPPPVAQVGP